MKFARALADDNGHDFVWPSWHRAEDEPTDELILTAEEMAAMSISIDDVLASSRQKAVVSLAPAPMQFQAMPLAMELQQQAQSAAQ